MPFLQFLNGGRDQAVEELHASASLILGSGDEAQIKCTDAGVSPQHCQVYPADGKYWLRDLGAGSTVFKMRRIGPNNPPEIVPIEPGEVFIIGTTYVKFWAQRPAAGGGGGGGADPAALEAAQAATQAAQAALEAAQATAQSAEAEAQRLQGELEALRSSGADASSALEIAQGEAQQLRADLEEVRAESEGLKGELAAAREEAAQAQQAAEEAREALERAQAESERALEAAREEAAEAAERATSEAEAARADLESALAATRGTLEGMRLEAEAAAHDPLAAAAGESDLGAAVAALQLEGELRLSLERAIAAEIDREVLRRVEGPVVPLRGLRVPGLEVDLEVALERVRARNRQLSLVQELGLGELASEELERLLEQARS